MNYERLRSSVQKHEGYRQLPYFDSLGFATVGYGHLIHNIELTAMVNYRTFGNLLRWLSDPIQHDIWLVDDLRRAESDAQRYIGDAWERLSDVRKEVLTEMAFQLGASRLGGFVKLRDAILSGLWVRAQSEMMDSRWAQQTPNRAKELASRMLEG
jgi:lysozyme